LITTSEMNIDEIIEKDIKLENEIYDKLDICYKFIWKHNIYTGYPFLEFNKFYKHCLR
jgi:hypothetical protein